MPIVWTRALVLVLALRAALAPFTYRPSDPDPLHRSSLVMRTRWWPPQRLQRFSGSSKLLQLFQGKNRLTADAEGRLVSRRGVPKSRVGLSRPTARLDAPKFSIGRMSIVLLC